MNKKLYVSNLSFSMNDHDLEKIFAEVGAVVSAKIIMDRSGRSKGFGFVEMTTEEEAKNAINDLNGKTQQGRNISVAEAKPQVPREFNNREFGGGGGGRDFGPRREGGGFRGRGGYDRNGG